MQLEGMNVVSDNQAATAFRRHHRLTAYLAEPRFIHHAPGHDQDGNK